MNTIKINIKILFEQELLKNTAKSTVTLLIMNKYSSIDTKSALDQI